MPKQPPKQHTPTIDELKAKYPLLKRNTIKSYLTLIEYLLINYPIIESQSLIKEFIESIKRQKPISHLTSIKSKIDAGELEYKCHFVRSGLKTLFDTLMGLYGSQNLNLLSDLSYRFDPLK